MLIHHDDRATKIPAATPVGPSGCGGTAPSPVSLLLEMNEHCFDRRSWNPAPLRSQRKRTYLRDSTLEQRIRPLLFRAVSHPIYAYPPEYPPLRLPAAPRILVVRTDRIGDAIVSTPLLRSLRTHFETARIDILLGQKNRIIAPLLPYIDEALVFPIRRPLRFIRAVRRRNYDLIVNLQLKPSVNASILCRLLGGREVLEYPLRAPFADGPSGSLHMVSMTSRLLGPLGIAAIRDDQSGEFPLEVTLPAAPIEFVDQVRHQLAGTEALRPLIFLNVSAGSLVRRPAGIDLDKRLWPVERFAELAIRLNEAGLQPVLCGAPGDEPSIERASELADGASRTLPTTGNYSDFAMLLSLATAVVSPDTSTTHLAAALGKPVVALFHRYQNSRTWGPWGTSSRIVSSDHGMGSIAVGPVLEAVMDLLGNGSGAR